MKKRNGPLSLLIIMLLSTSLSFGQEVVTSSGGNHSNAQAEISYTIGEPVTITVSDGTNDMTQGFQQTDVEVLGLEDLSPTLITNVFPNPSSSIINLEVDDLSTSLFCKLIDPTGKVVLNQEVTDNKSTYDVKALAAGTYTMVISAREQQLKTYKIIINH